MLQAPSPTKATVSPASSPLCSRTVSRSASSWQGWNSSVSALTTGTPASPPSLESRLGVGAPHDRRDLAVEHAGDVLDAPRATPSGEAAVDDHRVAAELGDADGERHPGAQGRLVEDHGDGLRAGERLVRRTARP